LGQSRDTAVDFFSRFGLDPNAALSLLHHVNLSSIGSGTQPSKEELLREAPLTKIVFEETHPRCIIATTQSVFEVLINVLKLEGPLFFVYKSFQYGSMVYRSPIGLYCGGSLFSHEPHMSAIVARLPNHYARLYGETGKITFRNFAYELADTIKDVLSMDRTP
jgi:hypothetical protein